MKKIRIVVCLVMLLAAPLGAQTSSQAGTTFKLYGFIKLEALCDNTEIAQGDWQLYARPGGTADAERPIFTMSVRHSRIGVDFEGPGPDPSTRIRAKIEGDFAGGFPNSTTAARQPQLRLRHAWVEIGSRLWELRFGQDWALISGPFPNTASFVVGAGKGNLWMRYPQIQAAFKNDILKIAASINRPMAGNSKYNDFENGDLDPVGDGERTGLPWTMARLWITREGFTLSASGHYGLERISDLSGAAHDLRSFSVNLDLQVTLGALSLTARAFCGQNLNSFFGGVFQGFTRDSVSVSSVTSEGGWAQAIFRVNERIAFTLGGGMDNPDNATLIPGMRSRNDWLFSNITLTLQKSLVFMLEGSWLKTSYLGDKAGSNLRVAFVTLWKF